jgi:hypothetical protein
MRPKHLYKDDNKLYVKYIPRRPRFKVPRQFQKPPNFSSVADSVLDTAKARWKYMQRMKALFAGRPLTFIWEADQRSPGEVAIPPSTPDRQETQIRHARKIKMSSKEINESMGSDDHEEEEEEIPLPGQRSPPPPKKKKNAKKNKDQEEVDELWDRYTKIMEKATGVLSGCKSSSGSCKNISLYIYDSHLYIDLIRIPFPLP